MAKIDPVEQYQWKPGQSGNPRGRPRKIFSRFKNAGYKLSEVNDTIQYLVQLSEAEIKDILKRQDITVLEKTVCKAILKSLKNGSLYSIETLLSRVYGKPKETVDATLSGKVKVTLNLNPTQQQK